MQRLKVTVDTGPWLDLIDERGDEYEYILKMLEWHKQGFIELFATSRILQDTAKKGSPRYNQLRTILDDVNNITISPCYDRWNYSMWNGPDVVLGSVTDYRTVEEIALFRQLISEPTTLNKSQVGNRLSNKIGDYNTLFNHFEKGRDVLITLDKRDLFAPDKRLLYKERLGIVILSPRDFVECYEPRIAIE
ncbi:MAG: hypothetical protein ACLQT6_01575 [Desulfomonilaceae bacterium]